MSNDSKCRAFRTGGMCECETFVPSASLDRGWKVCAVDGCGHTSAIHNGHKSRSNGSEAVPASVPSVKPASAPKVPSKPAESTSSVTGEITSAMMRKWLNDNKVPDVGVRGRLKPEHKAMAYAALSSQ